jgi:hypothetical protein
MSLSTENLIPNSPAANEPDVTKLEEEIEIAHLPLEDPVVGTCIHPITRGWRALVWTPSQLLVRPNMTDSVVPLLILHLGNRVYRRRFSQPVRTPSERYIICKMEPSRLVYCSLEGKWVLLVTYCPYVYNWKFRNGLNYTSFCL